MRWLLGPYAEPRTYRITLYLLVGLGLGVLDFTLLVTGFSLGIGLLVTIIGVPVLVVTFLVARGLAIIERRLAEALLDAPMPRRRRTTPEETGVMWRRLRSLATSRRTWSEMTFLMLRLPLATLDFAFITVVLAIMVSGIGMPIAVAAGADASIGAWTIDTVPESLVYLPLSIVFLLVGPRLVIAWGAMSSRIATRLLGNLDAEEIKREVVDVLARRQDADGFEILGELTLRLGEGPFLTPTRIEAALLALESSGRVEVDRTGPRAVYRLA
jgi:hypothetical protein